MSTVNRGGYAPENKRVVGLDLLRSCAILFVIGSHWFLHTDFNATTYHGVSMFLQGIWQSLTLINVPLFLLLTGYLNSNKQVGRKYYRNCVRVLLSYVVISVVTILFRRYYCHEDLSLVQWALKILDYSAIPYAWYIEMWIGLFFLTPFLNVLWKNMDTRRNKHILLLTFYLCTALPAFFNRYGVSLMPGYWANLTPLCYYFIGCYIKEYQPVVKSWKLWTLIGVLCLLNPVLNLVLAYGRRPMMHVMCTELTVIPMAAAFFTACYRLDFKNRFVSKGLERISLLSLDMYLASYMFDMLTYGFFKAHFAYTPSLWGLLFFLIIPLIFTGSFLFATLKDLLFRWVGRGK